MPEWYDAAMRLKIKAIRLERGLTVDQLAARVGMSKSYVSEIENERKQVNGRRLTAFAAALGVSTYDLIDDPTVARDIQEHIEIMSRLAPEDREAVEHLARSLARRTAGE